MPTYKYTANHAYQSITCVYTYSYNLLVATWYKTI